MHDILAMLSGGDRRSIGRANEVAAIVGAEPALLPVLLSGMLDPDPLICMRCADAAEKVTLRHPRRLQPHKAALLGELSLVDQPQLRWHVALMLPRLDLSTSEQRRVFSILESFLGDGSSIVRTCALQALHDLAMKYARWQPDASRLIEQHAATGTPAMRARGRKLLVSLADRSTGNSPVEQGRSRRPASTRASRTR